MAGYIAKEEKALNAIERQIAFAREYEDLGMNRPDWQDINACVKKAQAALPLKEIQVRTDIGNLELYADRLLEKVFYNLVDNALRYGGVNMTMLRITQKVDDGQLILTVEDDGDGISAEDKPRLFERGFGKHMGLGLAISREILALTGITIRETSRPGKGARFEITAPEGTWRMIGTQQAG
jgi:signal transduction histidine kinase